MDVCKSIVLNRIYVCNITKIDKKKIHFLHANNNKTKILIKTTCSNMVIIFVITFVVAGIKKIIKKPT